MRTGNIVWDETPLFLEAKRGGAFRESLWEAGALHLPTGYCGSAELLDLAWCCYWGGVKHGVAGSLLGWS